MSPHSKLEAEIIAKRRFRITCGNCAYSWVSESKAHKRISCSKCKTSITLPRNLKPLPTSFSDSTLSPETQVKLDKIWSAEHEEEKLRTAKLFSDSSLTTAEKLIRYSQYLEGLSKEAKKDAEVAASRNLPDTATAFLLMAKQLEESASVAATKASQFAASHSNNTTTTNKSSNKRKVKRKVRRPVPMTLQNQTQTKDHTSSRSSIRRTDSA